MSSNIFVCFIGIDGSGKSTLAKKIFEDYVKKNKKTKITYGRFTPIFSKFVMYIGKKIFMNKENDMYVDYEKYLKEKKSIIRKKPTLAKMYISLIITEYLLEVLFKIIIPRKFGYSIISDRYVYDTVINDIGIDLGLSIEETNKIIYRLFKFLPKPDKTFFVDIEEKLAFSRKNDIPSVSYLEKRRKYYCGLEFDEISRLDASLEIETLVKSVIEKIDDLR